MIAVDTNILVHAHRRDSNHHAAAERQLRRLIHDGRAWAIAWPCLHEFYAVVTSPALFRPPSTLDEALQQMAAWTHAPNVELLSETSEHSFWLERILRGAHVVGGRAHDARIAAICLQHRVSELWTADRDFSQFPELRTWNPLTDDSQVHDHTPAYGAAVRARTEGRRRAARVQASR